jgi:hypothetical protein
VKEARNKAVAAMFGVLKKTEEQPHANEITHAPMPEMPSPNSQREFVPVSSDA